MARVVLPIAGAVIGSFFGMPQVGWAIGSIIGNAVDPQVVKGPSVGEIPNQTSQEGGPRPIIFAQSQPIAGNIIASSEPKIVKRRQSQGKGGPKVETESVYRTYAIGVCEGEIAAFFRVWRNGMLVYDARSGTTDPNNAKFLEKARFFLGSYSQDPSPDLEALFGVGTTPAHRGTAYMVIADDDLTDTRGAIPQYVFEVSGSGALNCESVTEYSNDVLFPWVDDDNPINPLNTHLCRFINRSWHIPDNIDFATPELALAHAEGLAGQDFPNYNGHAVAVNTALQYRWGTTNRVGGPTAASADCVYTYMHYTHPAAGVYISNLQSCGPTGTNIFSDGYFNDSLWGSSYAGMYRKGPGIPGDYGAVNVVVTCGDTNNNYLSHSMVIRVERVARPPIDICDAEGATPFDDTHCLLPNGFVVERQPWVYHATTYKALQKYAVGGVLSPTTLVTAYPLNPVRPIGHAQYDDQAFWESAYADAVASGDMPAGLVYGVNYPVTQPYGYSVTYDNCIFLGGSLLLKDVVEAICLRAGLTQIDVSELIGNVRGFTVTNTYPAYAALQALSEIFLFDPMNADGIVKFIHRGADTVTTIDEDEMVDDEEQDIEQEKRGDSISIPRVMNLNYYDVEGGISTDKQTSERAGDRRAVGEVSLQTAVILNANEAARIVVINHKVAIEDAKGEIKFSLPDSFIFLSTTDNVFVQRGSKYLRCRIVKCDMQDGYQEYVCLRDRQSAYTSDVEGIPAAPQTSPPSGVVGPTIIQPLDIHILKDADDSVGLGYYVAVCGLYEAWQGATVELSYNGGSDYVSESSTNVEAIIGEILTELNDHPAEYPDDMNSFSVRIDTPNAQLDSTTFIGMLNRDNLAAVGSVSDGWELIQFTNANETSEGIWELSYLLRGRKGSTTRSHSVGEKFVLLDRNQLNFIPAELIDVGRTLTFRATSFGTSVEDATIISMTYSGRSQIEREVGYLSAHRSGSDIVASWQGVGRLGAGVSAAQGIRFEGYRVTFSDGSNPDIVVDTLDQVITQDVSSLVGSVTISVAQINSLTQSGPITQVTVL